MRTERDAKTAIFQVVRDSALAGAVTGSIYKDRKPASTTQTGNALEDIVISTQDSNVRQIQQFTVYVRLYVPDQKRNGEFIENGPRLDILCPLCFSILEVVHGEYEGDGYRASLERQAVYEADTIGYHVIANRMRVQFFINS